MNPIREIVDRLRADRYLSLVASASAVNAVVTALGIGLMFVFFLVLARVLGTAEYGVFSVVFSWLTILSLLATLGADQLLLRQVAVYRLQGEVGSLRGLLSWSSSLVWLAGTVAGVVTALVVWALGDRLEPQLRIAFWIGCLALPLLAQVHLGQQVLRSLQHFLLGIIPDRILRPVGLILLILAAAQVLPATDSGDALLILLVTTAGSVALLKYWVASRLPDGTREAPPVYRHREWLRASLPLLVVSGMQVVMSNTDVVMLGILADTQQAGVYLATTRIASVIAYGPLIVSTIAAPIISELYTLEDTARLQRLVSFAALWISLAVAAMAVAAVLLGQEILGLFGADFMTGYAALLILCAGQMFNALCGPVGYLLAMTGHQDAVARVLTGGAVLNILGNAVMIPLFGIIGAATATAVATALWSLGMVVQVRRRLKIRPTVFSVILTPINTVDNDR